MRIKDAFFTALGFIALGLGTVGAVLPLLPTVPFLLLACFCFATGSKRFHRWFTGTRLYKKHLEEFVRTRAMTLRKKLTICIPVAALLIFWIIVLPNWIHRVGIIVLMLFKWYYFAFRIKTVPRESD